jgi:uncharacterized repeat protein (TIGR01451 family)
MKSKMVSILISIIMVMNISGAITQNVGQSGSTSSETGRVVSSNISAPIPQFVRQPSSKLSGTSGLADSPWPMFRQNVRHTGVSPYDTSANPGKLKWKFSTGREVRSSPAIGADGTIYICSLEPKLYALYPDGKEKWNFGITSTVSSPAISCDGTIYVAHLLGELYAINPDGTEKWSFKIGNAPSSPTIGSDGTIYIGSADNYLYAINDDGSEKWKFRTGGSVLSSPAIGFDGTIYVGSSDDKIYAINPDGSVKWNFITGGFVRSSPAIGSDGTIYVGSRDNYLYAINDDGSLKWRFKTGDFVESSPAIGSNGTIYVGSWDNNLYAINRDGSEKWRFKTGDWVESSPAIGSDGTIYIGSYDNKLYAINPNGTEKWNFITGLWVPSSPAIGSDGTIYIGSRDDKLYAIGTPPLDFTIEKTANVTIAKPGNLIDYTIYYNNTGPDNADSVLICDILPTGVEFVTSSAEINRTGDYNWTFFDVDVGTHSFTITAQITSNIPNGTILKNFVHLDFTDSRGNSMPGLWNSVDVTVLHETQENQHLIANAGFDQNVYEGDVVHFDGTNSYAINGIIESYEWDLDSYMDSDGDGDPANDVDATGPKPSYVYSDDGVYDVSLNVRTTINSSTVEKSILDVIFVIDSSGSMVRNDRNDLRIIESQNFVANHLKLPDRGAVVDFDGDAFLIPEATPEGDHLHTNYDKIIYNIGLINSEGGTVLCNGMNLSNEELRQYSNPKHKPIIILLTDAEELDQDPNDIPKSYNEANISAINSIVIFTIGLKIPQGSQSEQLLQDIANITGGRYFPAADPTHFEAIYEEISELIENQTTIKLYDSNMMQVTVGNVPPKLEAFGPFVINEGTYITCSANATDPGSDDLTFTWNWGDGTPDTETTYYNDGTGPEPVYNPASNEIKSPWGTYPFNATDTVSHIYGDNGEYTVTLTVKDDDGGISVYKTNITVSNVNPAVTIESVIMDVEIGLRIAGRKYNNVNMTLYEEDNSIGHVSIERMPGSPNDQMAWIPVILNMTKTYHATVTYTPEDPPNVGANPVWIYIKSKNGSINKIHHTFNVQQSKKRDSEHWNHVEPWEVDLNDYFIGLPFEITSHITDPGSDDEILTFTYGSQTVTVTYLNNPPNPDPYPSPEVKPVDIMDATTLVYEGLGTVTLVVKDDDGGTTITTIDLT